MEPKGFIPVFEDKEVLVEIDIRGRFLMMACDIEWTMLNIMMHCAPDPMNQLRRFRNDLAHKKLHWEGNSNFKDFKFLFIQDGENGEDRLFIKLYTIEQLKDYLMKFRALEVSLATLAEKLKLELVTNVNSRK